MLLLAGVVLPVNRGVTGGDVDVNPVYVCCGDVTSSVGGAGTGVSCCGFTSSVGVPTCVKKAVVHFVHLASYFTWQLAFFFYS